MIRMPIATKVVVCVVGVLVLAVLSSTVGLLSTWHTWELLNRTFQGSLTAIVAAEELDIAVLEQRGFVSAYLLDNANPLWLDRLQARKSNFDQWLATAQAISQTAQERQILVELEAVYREYDAKRDRVVQLFDQGERRAAERLLLDDVHVLYERAYDLCEQFILANRQTVDDALVGVHRQVRWVITAVVCSVLLTIGLGMALLWVFFRGVVQPVRTLVAEAQEMSGDGPTEGRGLPTDELRAVGIYLRHLMTDVADARSTLERSRRELKAAEQLAAVGKLAASVAHEIRNPLTAMKMWLYSIQKEVDGDEALNRKFEIVSSEIKRLEKVVREFLEFSRPQEPRLGAESLGALVDQTVELMQPRLAGPGVRIVQGPKRDLPLIWADRELLKQVLLNLLANSVDAVGEGGEIQVTSTCESTAGGSFVVVRIRDTGSGMSEEVRHRIFEPFFTTKRSDGTGLGLAISARIMAQHRGRLTLESTGPGGTTFAIHIPAAKGA